MRNSEGRNIRMTFTSHSRLNNVSSRYNIHDFLLVVYCNRRYITTCVWINYHTL